MDSKIVPSTLILYLTKRCDSRCPFCTWILKDPDFFHTRADLDTSIEAAKKIVDYYYGIGTRKVRLQAEGEVLIYAHLYELLEYCKKKGFKDFDFPTNAISMYKHIDFILRNLSSVSISIDGHDAPTFIYQRGGTEATFNKVLDNTRELVKRKKEMKSKTRIMINCVIHSKDYDKKAVPMIRLAEGLGVDAIRFSNFHAIEGGGGLRGLSSKQVRHLRKMCISKKNKVKVKLPRLRNAELLESKSKQKYYCSMLFKNSVIGSEGNYSPCCRIDSDPKWGCFGDDSKHNSKALRKLRMSFLTANHIKDLGHPYCHNCTRLKTRKK